MWLALGTADMTSMAHAHWGSVILKRRRSRCSSVSVRSAANRSTYSLVPGGVPKILMPFSEGGLSAVHTSEPKIDRPSGAGPPPDDHARSLPRLLRTPVFFPDPACHVAEYQACPISVGHEVKVVEETEDQFVR